MVSMNSEGDGQALERAEGCVADASQNLCKRKPRVAVHTPQCNA